MLHSLRHWSITCLALAVITPLCASDDGSAFADAINTFGLDLLTQETKGVSKNTLLSPYSIHSSLFTAYIGSAGQTRDEMHRVLRLSSDSSDLLTAAARLRSTLLDATIVERPKIDADELKSGGVELVVANRLFTQRGFTFIPDYRKSVAALGSELEEVDFETNAPAAADTINAWVSQTTHDRISNIAAGFDRKTKAVLANAVYFRASWASQFEPTVTRLAAFWVDGKVRSEVPTMMQKSSFGYRKGRGYIMLALPYDEGTFQYVVILPDKREGLPALIKKITAHQLRAATEMPLREISLFLPKFRLKNPPITLRSQLRQLGMATAFDVPRLSANFTHMASLTPEGYFVLSDVLHQTWCAVDENGTEAAAATSVTIELSPFGGPNPQPIEVRVDRPFLFAIQHVASGACLFLGQVTDPQL